LSGNRTIETARLILRPPVEADLDGWAAMVADGPAMLHMGGAKPRPAAWRGLAMMAGSWALRGHGMFSVIERSSGRWVGRVGPWHPEGWPGTEIGWSIVRESWGRGYATEAAAASIAWAIGELGWTDIVHVIAPANTQSAAVARRLGSANRGPTPLPAPFEDEQADLWGQTAAKWRQHNTA
jgi:RimJ/RimL family protein N-acetyltransferase